MSHSKSVVNIYNPLNQTEKELLENYVVREKEYEIIFSDIKASKMDHPEPHFIIQGQRGQGKTTLLLKLYYEIKRDEILKQYIVPIIFNEEQYHVNTLFSLWALTAEELEEEDPEFRGIYDRVEEAYESEEPEMEAFNRLEQALEEKNKKALLLIDNLGQLLSKMTDREHQRIREVLITSPEFRFIGTSAMVLEFTYDYSKPFYELFRIINLEGLKQEEASSLLLKLGEHYKQENIKKIVEEEPGRIEALRRLTSGVPRTMVLLFEIFVDHEHGDAFRDLEFILDRVTPLYKHRMDDLSPQQQKIVDAIALNWDAVPAKDIAKKVRMESKAVSSHLKILEKNHIIQRIKTSTKNHLYQISERFFNIWYLMRYGRRRGKSRVQWLVHFFQSWCSETELSDRTRKHINAVRNGKISSKQAFYLTEALAATSIPAELQHTLISTTREFLEKKEKSLQIELFKGIDVDETIATDYSLILLWNDQIEESLNMEKRLLQDKNYVESSIFNGNEYLLLLMAKKQYYAALNLFEECPFDLKERIKPVYYALMHFLKDDFPNEYIKMGPELKQTVEEVIQKVHQWEKEYT